MNTDADSTAMIPPRPARRGLLWTIPFTVLWTWLIYSLLVLLESGLLALAVRLTVHGPIALSWPEAGVRSSPRLLHAGHDWA